MIFGLFDGLFGKPKEEKEVVMFEGKPIIEDHKIDPLGYIKKMYVTQFVSDGKYGCMALHSWDGFYNFVKELDFMDRLGWEFYAFDRYDVQGERPSDDYIELVFKRRLGNKLRRWQ